MSIIKWTTAKTLLNDLEIVITHVIVNTEPQFYLGRYHSKKPMQDLITERRVDIQHPTLDCEKWAPMTGTWWYDIE